MTLFVENVLPTAVELARDERVKILEVDGATESKDVREIAPFS